MPNVSPLAPASFPPLVPIAGVRLAACEAGVRYSGRTDLMVAELAPGSTVAGVFTRSTMPGQPVIWCRECLPGGKVRAHRRQFGQRQRLYRPRRQGGRRGDRGDRCRPASAATLSEVFISSTGVIGEPPPAEKIIAALPNVVPLTDGRRTGSRRRARS